MERITKKHVGLRVYLEPDSPRVVEAGVYFITRVGRSQFNAVFEANGEIWNLITALWRVVEVLPPA